MTYVVLSYRVRRSRDVAVIWRGLYRSRFSAMARAAWVRFIHLDDTAVLNEERAIQACREYRNWMGRNRVIAPPYAAAKIAKVGG
jgi:hypothetical protein